MQYIIFNSNKILIYEFDGIVAIPNTAQIDAILPQLTEIASFENYVIATIKADFDQFPESLKLINLRSVFSLFDFEFAQKMSYAKQLAHYYISHKFCGSCGHATILRANSKFVYCPQCQTERYPHIAPCVIVRIHRGNQILMARGVNFPPNVWGLVAGFVEIGESLEHAISREVLEEVGIKITNIKYWGSQPWPFPDNSLMTGFTADYLSGEVTPDKTEISEAGFFDKEHIPGLPSTSLSIASKMILEWL